MTFQAQGQDQNVVLTQTDTTLPGISLQVMQVVRVPPNLLLLVVRVNAGAAAQKPTPLGNGIPRDASVVDISSGKYKEEPFSLLGAVLIEQASGSKYPALQSQPSSPYYGPSEIVSQLNPGGWLQMAVAFPAPPPPPPDSNGKVPVQKVYVVFPMAKLPAKDLVIPPADNP